MSDFIAAINAGIGSAKSADAAIKEINSILAELDASVREATQGRVHVELQKNPYHEAFSSFVANSSATVLYDLALVTPSSKEKVSFATLSRSSDGFPVQLATGAASITAGNAKGLRTALAEIMAKGDTGRLLLRFVESADATADHATGKRRLIRKI